MRANRTPKRNPNPPWPAEQSVVVVPPGSSATAIGKPDSMTRNVSSSAKTDIASNAAVVTPFERESQMPIMGYVGNSREELGVAAGQGMLNANRNPVMDVSEYLNKSLGKYAKVEFLFGDNTHIEKNGILKTIGKDFIVLEEAGSQNHVVCAVKNIKFINIYNVK